MASLLIWFVLAIGSFIASFILILLGSIFYDKVYFYFLKKRGLKELSKMSPEELLKPDERGLNDDEQRNELRRQKQVAELRRIAGGEQSSKRAKYSDGNTGNNKRRGLIPLNDDSRNDEQQREVTLTKPTGL